MQAIHSKPHVSARTDIAIRHLNRPRCVISGRAIACTITSPSVVITGSELSIRSVLLTAPLSAGPDLHSSCTTASPVALGHPHVPMCPVLLQLHHKTPALLQPPLLLSRFQRLRLLPVLIARMALPYRAALTGVMYSCMEGAGQTGLREARK